MQKKFIAGLVLKLAIVLSALAGISLQINSGSKDWMESGSIFLYFTTQSNIWIALIALPVIIFDLVGKGRRDLPKTLYAIKFMFTASISLTFVVFSLLLAPLMPRSYLLSPSNLFLHNITAFFALADFWIFDRKMTIKKGTWLLAVIMPALYLVFVLILASTGPRFSGNLVPYFFLDYQKLGWLRIGQGGIGVAYWIAILFALSGFIGWGILFVVKKLAKASRSLKAGL
jgi:hypothetical protein